MLQWYHHVISKLISRQYPQFEANTFELIINAYHQFILNVISQDNDKFSENYQSGSIYAAEIFKQYEDTIFNPVTSFYLLSIISRRYNKGLPPQYNPQDIVELLMVSLKFTLMNTNPDLARNINADSYIKGIFPAAETMQTLLPIREKTHKLLMHGEPLVTIGEIRNIIARCNYHGEEYRLLQEKVDEIALPQLTSKDTPKISRFFSASDSSDMSDLVPSSPQMTLSP